jgi:hypothetical protein
MKEGEKEGLGEQSQWPHEHHEGSGAREIGKLPHLKKKGGENKKRTRKGTTEKKESKGRHHQEELGEKGKEERERRR